MDLGPVQERREGELFCSLTLNALERYRALIYRKGKGQVLCTRP